VSPSKSKRPPVKILIFPAILRRLRKIGIHLEPFFTVREGGQILPTKSSNFRFDFLAENDFEALVEFSRSEERQVLRSWLDQGKRCFVAWDGSRMIANMWCDFEEFNFPPNYRRLDEDEVYLFAAFAHPDYRGQNLAPQMRNRCYAALRSLGRSRFYSYTDYFNVPARRFKEKLGARNETLRLYVRLFGRWSRTITLRTYR
jgi:GNAT superfamily N-acetyltransferase